MRNQPLFFFTWAVMAFVPMVISHHMASHKNLNLTQLAQKWGPIRKGKRYFVEADTQLRWVDAHQFCKFHGMELASVDSKAELTEVEAALKKTKGPDQYLWLSGMRMGEKAFYWISNGMKVIFQNWESGYPFGSAFGNWCILTSLHTPSEWKDNLCMDKYAFVCEYYVD